MTLAECADALNSRPASFDNRKLRRVGSLYVLQLHRGDIHPYSSSYVNQGRVIQFIVSQRNVKTPIA